MEDIGIAGLVLIVINIIVSYKGFKDNIFLETYSFKVDEILIRKDYKRLIISGFLHVSWSHLVFNMLSLYFFSTGIESELGIFQFLIIYFGGLIGGNLFALYIHKNHGDYSAVGASGAISGVIFASIALFEGMGVGFFFIPISIPGWLYGLLFVLLSIYGIKSQKDNIGHEAHLGGGIIGLLIALIMVPSSLLQNHVPIALLLVPTLIFLIVILLKPDFLIFKKINFGKAEGLLDVDDKYNATKIDKEKELNQLLDKIHKNGIKKLTKKEKERLEELSK